MYVHLEEGMIYINFAHIPRGLLHDYGNLLLCSSNNLNIFTIYSYMYVTFLLILAYLANIKVTLFS